MRRLICLVLGLPLTMSLTACGSNGIRTSTPAAQATATRNTAESRASASASGTAPPQGSVVSSRGTLLTPPMSPTTRPVSADCDLLDPGWHGTCGILESKFGVAAAVNEGKAAPSGAFDERSLVYRRTGNEWELVLRSAFVVQPGQGAPRAVVVDLAGDGIKKFVVVFPNPDDPTFMKAIDVVEANGNVVIHVTLNRGKARQAGGGGVEVWIPEKGDSTYRHEIIRYQDGAWRVVSSEIAPASQLPQGTAKDPGTF